MTAFEQDIFKTLIKNAPVFLNCAIQAINSGLRFHHNQIVAIVNLQIALELAIKARLVEKYGGRRLQAGALRFLRRMR